MPAAARNPKPGKSGTNTSLCRIMTYRAETVWCIRRLHWLAHVRADFHQTPEQRRRVVSLCSRAHHHHHHHHQNSRLITTRRRNHTNPFASSAAVLPLSLPHECMPPKSTAASHELRPEKTCVHTGCDERLEGLGRCGNEHVALPHRDLQAWKLCLWLV